jgi:hypothetical protein
MNFALHDTTSLNSASIDGNGPDYDVGVDDLELL